MVISGLSVAWMREGQLTLPHVLAARDGEVVDGLAELVEGVAVCVS